MHRDPPAGGAKVPDQKGLSYILTKKGIKRAGSNVGLMFIAYNLRRIGNILTPEVLKEYLRMFVSLFPARFDLSGVIFVMFKRFKPAVAKLTCKNSQWLKNSVWSLK